LCAIKPQVSQGDEEYYKINSVVGESFFRVVLMIAFKPAKITIQNWRESVNQKIIKQGYYVKKIICNLQIQLLRYNTLKINDAYFSIEYFLIIPEVTSK